MKRIAVIFAALALAACGEPSDGKNAEVRAQIEEHNAALAAWYAAGEIDKVAAVFAEDAWQMPPNTPALVGREAIREYWKEAVRLGRWTFKLDTQSVAVNGTMAVERGKYVLSFQPRPDASHDLAAFEDRGNYLVQWRREDDGAWRIVADAPVSEVPLKP